MKKKLKQITPYIINILITLILFLTCLWLNKTFPFGENILGKSDAIVQFKPMLYNLITNIKEGIIGPFSFNNGLGNPVIFDFLYYLASPLNAIAFLFKDANSMYLSTILLKIALASCTITFYAKKKTNNNFFSCLICLTYVFSSWFIAYYYYLPWLDIFLIFPLFQYGLESLLKEKKYNLYIFTLAFTIISNFYLAFPVCIYTILYFIFFNLYNKQTKSDFLNSFNRITLSTLVSLLLASFYIYALFTSYLKMGLTFSDTISSEYTITFLDFIKSLLYGNISFVVSSSNTFPNIALNTFALINIVYYFLNKNISKKEKGFALIIALLCIIAIFIKPVDFVLNFFHNVRGLTYRYAFIICFLMLIPFIRNIQTSKEIDKKVFHLASLPILLLLLINYKNMEKTIFILNLVYLISYNIVILFYKKNKITQIILFLLIVSETILAAYPNLTEETTSKENIPDYFYTEPIPYRQNKITDENEYFNWNLYSNSKVTYLLTSMTYNRVFNLVESLGCDNAMNTSLYCTDNNQIASMLLNVKNNYYLEKIFSVNKDILYMDLNPYNTKETQENLISSMTNIQDIFDATTLEGTQKEDGKYYYNPNHDFYFIDFENENGDRTNFAQTYQEFTTNLDVNKPINIYTVNQEKLKEAHEALSKNQINYTSYSDSSLEGTIHVEENQIIFTSIPYDTAWKITIDGKQVEPIMLLDSLLGIEVEPGTHTIKLEYKNNFTIPIILSITTLTCLILNMYLQKKKSTNIKQ